MREALIEQRDITVVLLNYHKDGTPFWNQIELAHLRDSTNKIRFIIGVQNKVVLPVVNFTAYGRLLYFFHVLV